MTNRALLLAVAMVCATALLVAVLLTRDDHEPGPGIPSDFGPMSQDG